LWKFINRVLWFALKNEDSCDGASSSGAFNGGATLFCQTYISFEFDLGLTSSPFFTCSSSMFSVLKSTIQNWQHFECIIIAGSKFLLYNLGDQLPHTFLEVCSAHEDKVKIKCMGSIGGKSPTEPKLYLFLTSLRHIES
jgi:hypothetical protein